MRNLLTTVGVLHGQIKRLRVNGRHVHAPAFGRIGFGRLQRDELGEVSVIERIGLAHVAAGVELVEPHTSCAFSFFKKQNNRLHARADERASGAVEHGVEVAFFEEFLPQAHGSVVGVRQEGVLDDDPRAAAGLEDFNEMLEEEERGLAGADGEVLLHFLALFAAEGRIGDDDVETIPFLNIGEVLGECVRVNDVRRFDAVQDHVHDRDHVGEGLLFLPVEAALLQGAILGGRALGILGAEVIEGFAEEASRTDCGIADRLAQLRRSHSDDGSDERARCVILAAVAPSVAHIFDLSLVEVREFVLLGLGGKAEFVDVVDDLAEVVAALDAVLYLTEDFANFVFDGIRLVARLGLEAVEIGKELLVDEVEKVIAAQRGVVVNLAVLALRRSPRFPAVGLVEDVGIALALQRRLGGLVALECIEVF